MNNKTWLILEKSDETRVSGSIESYKDRTGEVYNYDSLVPNFKNIASNDTIIIRKEDEILGIGRIDKIISTKSIKIHKRCPKCSTTDIRIRKGKSPQWKCGRCKIEFQEPSETTTDVTNFKAEISDFTKFDLPPTVSQIKSCALKGDGLKSQNSILQLDTSKISKLIPYDNFESAGLKSSEGQGLGLTYDERRAIELRAMKIVHELYSQDGWTLVDTSNSRPYDFEAAKGDEIRYIEVKGTSGDGASIILTHGEVKHVFDNQKNCALVIVSKIKLSRKSNNTIASEGEIFIHLDPWRIDENLLKPTQYRYSLM